MIEEKNFSFLEKRIGKLVDKTLKPIHLCGMCEKLRRPKHIKNCKRKAEFTINEDILTAKLQEAFENKKQEIKNNVLELLKEENKPISLDRTLYLKNQCAICYGTKQVETVACENKHSFCLQCLQNDFAFTKSNLCPYCKQV